MHMRTYLFGVKHFFFFMHGEIQMGHMKVLFLSVHVQGELYKFDFYNTFFIADCQENIETKRQFEECSSSTKASHYPNSYDDEDCISIGQCQVCWLNVLEVSKIDYEAFLHDESVASYYVDNIFLESEYLIWA